jgi:glycosyltransferase involved in cell wall biosynthesis/GT2 family glycosyltransferase
VPAHWIDPDETIGAHRGDVVVVIPVFGAHEHFVGCVRSVLQHTPVDVKIVICDDASPDDRSREFIAQIDRAGAIEHDLVYMRRTENVGFPANVNGGLAVASPADVVILNSDCVVATGWLEGLREAAHADSNVATATALTNHGSVVSVPERGVPMADLPADWSFTEAAAAVRARSSRLHPRLLTAVGHCVYVRRSALELIGDFDLAFSPGYGEEVDFSQRCLRAGLSHVAADDVLVLHHGGGSFASNGVPNQVQQEHEVMIAARYPYYLDSVRAVESDITGPLARSLSAARRALKGLSVVIDARILVSPMTGTQLHVLELIAALSRTGEVRVNALVPADLGHYARLVLDGLPRVQLTTIGQGRKSVSIPRGDLVHRPFQISDAADLPFLAPLGERLLITHQDMIGYRNPTYFRSFREWDDYRRVTRKALAVADRTLFFSAHARADALAEDLVEPHRAEVVHIGVDHVVGAGDGPAVPPRGIEQLPDDVELMLCLGTDFRHKNRVFAIRILDALQRRHGWRGRLILVGPRVALGSSAADEDQLLALRPRLSDAVVMAAAVSEAEKAWLMRRARLVVYPTVYEGFGLVPFEAATHGVPCLWAPGTSLSELLPDAAAGIVPWDVEASADRALELMGEPDVREHNLETIRGAAAKLTWDAAASRLLEVYRSTCDEPASPAGALERTQGLMHGELSEDALRLIGPDGAIPRDLERPLLALATHPQIGDPVFRAIKAGYRASFRLRWRGRTDDDGVDG